MCFSMLFCKFNVLKQSYCDSTFVYTLHFLSWLNLECCQLSFFSPGEMICKTNTFFAFTIFLLTSINQKSRWKFVILLVWIFKNFNFFFLVFSIMDPSDHPRSWKPRYSKAYKIIKVFSLHTFWLLKKKSSKFFPK